MKCNFCRKDLWQCVQPIPFLFPSPFSISIVEKPSGQLPGQSVVGREGIVGMCTNEVRNIFTSGLRSKLRSSMAHSGKIRGMESGEWCLTFVSNSGKFCESCHL